MNLLGFFFSYGSKDRRIDAIGSADAVPRSQVRFKKRTSVYLNVYVVELYTMLMTLEWIEQFCCINILY